VLDEVLEHVAPRDERFALDAGRERRLVDDGREARPDGRGDLRGKRRYQTSRQRRAGERHERHGGDGSDETLKRHDPVIIAHDT